MLKLRYRPTQRDDLSDLIRDRFGKSNPIGVQARGVRQRHNDSQYFAAKPQWVDEEGFGARLRKCAAQTIVALREKRNRHGFPFEHRLAEHVFVTEKIRYRLCGDLRKTDLCRQD